MWPDSSYICQFPNPLVEAAQKLYLEEVRVKGDYINGDHVIFAELEISEIVLDRRKYCTQNGFFFFPLLVFCVLHLATEINAIATTKIFCLGSWWQVPYARLLDMKSGILL